MNDKELALRALNDADMDLLASWLNKDYVLKWYHDADEWLAEIRGRHGAYSWIHHFIAVEGKTPVGFCQYYDCYDAKELEDWYHVSTPGDTFSIDYLIGNEAYLGKGYGKAIVGLLTNAIQAAESAKRIIVQPEKENHASNHVLTATGYVYDEAQKYYCKTLN
ncbi:MAG TPA: GNAT family N-acetyltransferase [Candidatus Acidoferrum sp.]|nr:GNAT family N-acetyltransferase [Candidatus Acidoferrum sp.]